MSEDSKRTSMNSLANLENENRTMLYFCAKSKNIVLLRDKLSQTMFYFKAMDNCHYQCKPKSNTTSRCPKSKISTNALIYAIMLH